MADLLKVNGPAMAALGLSFTDIEAVLRITALLLSIAWTVWNFLNTKPKGKK